MFVCHSSITVVQSYFVYWAGIESKVVHDASRSPWNGSNVTGMDEWNSRLSLQEDQVTALPGTQLHCKYLKEIKENASYPAPNLKFQDSVA